MVISLTPTDYLHKKVFVHPFAGYEWAFPRRVSAIRQIVNSNGTYHWEARVRNIVWREWHALDRLRLIYIQK